MLETPSGVWEFQVCPGFALTPGALVWDKVWGPPGPSDLCHQQNALKYRWFLIIFGFNTGRKSVLFVRVL